MAALVYATVGSNQLDDAKAFYDALLGSAGIKPVNKHPSGGRVYGANRTPNFAVLGPHDGQPASVGNGTMFAFGFDMRQEVDAFHPIGTEARRFLRWRSRLSRPGFVVQLLP